MIICVASTKGGVGKTTIADNLAVEAALSGKKTLLVDSDVQGSSMAFRSIREKDDIKALSITTPTLHKDLPTFNSQFDIIIVDAGGRETTVFRSAILASDIVAVPILPSQYDIWAAGDTVSVLKEAKVYKNLKAYFLFNQLIQSAKIGGEAEEALKEIMNGAEISLLNAKLFSRVAYKNSISKGLGVSEFEPAGKASLEIKALYKEIIEL